MKMKLLFSILMLPLFLRIASAQQNTYSKVFFDSQFNGIQANSVISTPDKGFLIAGNATYNSGFIMKVDSVGNDTWNKSYAIGSNTGFTKIFMSKDSNYFVVGSAYSSTSFTNNAFYAKLTPQGDTLWARSINFGVLSSEALNAVATNDSGLVLTGYLSQNSAPYFKIIVCKINKNGTLQWSKILEGGNNSNIGTSIKQTADSGFIVTGYIENFPPFESNTFLLKLNKQGNAIWAKKYNKGNNNVCSGNDVEITGNGYLNYLNAGGFADIMKTDLSGNMIWVKTVSQFVNQSCINCVTPKINKTRDGGYFMLSGDMGFGGITKVDSLAQVQWQNNLFFITVDGFEAADNGYFFIGNGPVYGIRLASPTSSQIGVIKADSLGNQSTCTYANGSFINVPDTLAAYPLSLTNVSGGIASALHPIYTTLTLLHDSGCVTFLSGIEQLKKNEIISVYPNPSNGSFTIEFVSSLERATIEVLNVTGEKVYETKLNHHEKKQVELNALAPGMYFLKAYSGNTQELKKIMIH